jgi:hypothetical protein
MTQSFVICVATNSSFRISSFLKSINQTVDRNEIFLVIVDTGKNRIDQSLLGSIDMKYHYQWIPQQERILYAEVMRLKIETSSRFCNESTIYWNSDDDYVFNPYWYKVAKTLFENHEEISYLSLLKVNRTIEEFPKDYSNFQLIRAYSCMGGAFGARHKELYPTILDYFKWYGTNNMFDQNFWIFLGQTVGYQNLIHIIQDFSLIQQCNLISSYLNQKGSKKEHQYGIDFEPVGNPFIIVE